MGPVIYETRPRKCVISYPPRRLNAVFLAYQIEVFSPRQKLNPIWCFIINFIAVTVSEFPLCRLFRPRLAVPVGVAPSDGMKLLRSGNDVILTGGFGGLVVPRHQHPMGDARACEWRQSKAPLYVLERNRRVLWGRRNGCGTVGRQCDSCQGGLRFEG